MDRVREFHEAFDCGLSDRPRILDVGIDGTVSLNTAADKLDWAAKYLKIQAKRANENGREEEGLALIRGQIMIEELEEVLREMANAGDLSTILAELTDLDYVVKGTFLAYGLQDLKESAMDEIHRANMSKLFPDGKPRLDESGRVMKPEGFIKANIRKLFPF